MTIYEQLIRLRHEREYGLTPEQYHAGLDKLWKALKLTGVQDTDVFTLAAERIEFLTNDLEVIAWLGTSLPSDQDTKDTKESWKKLARDCIEIARRVLDAAN